MIIIFYKLIFDNQVIKFYINNALFYSVKFRNNINKLVNYLTLREFILIFSELLMHS